MFELIEKIMKENNISLNDLLKNTSVSQQQFSNWKTKKSKPSTETIKELAKFFNVRVGYFFDGKLTEDNNDFSNEVLLLAREINNNDKLQLVKDIMRIKEEADVKIIEMMTKKILEGQR